MSAGMQLYFYIAKIPIPIVGTTAVQTPELSGVRSIIHFILFGLCLYSGFIKNPTHER